jgi:mRNA interferase MazF
MSGIRRPTVRPMPSFKQGDVVKVPFPYTDRATRQARPALVVSVGGLEDAHELLWVTMITSAENRGWPGDVPVTNLSGTGLPALSVIRTAKIATIESSDATRLGKTSTSVVNQVVSQIGRELGIR